MRTKTSNFFTKVFGGNGSVTCERKVCAPLRSTTEIILNIHVHWTKSNGFPFETLDRFLSKYKSKYNLHSPGAHESVDTWIPYFHSRIESLITVTVVTLIGSYSDSTFPTASTTWPTRPSRVTHPTNSPLPSLAPFPLYCNSRGLFFVPDRAFYRHLTLRT